MALFESAIGGVAVSVFDQAIKAGKYAAKEIRGAYSKTQHDQRVIAASKAYIENYLKWQCQIKIMPGLMKEPLDLEKIYTTVKLLDDESRRTFLGLEELEGEYRVRGKRGFGSGQAERLGGMEVANSKQFLMVLGGPGIGKSTFLRKIGLETLKKEGQIQRECIPVFLELKKFREEQIDIKQKIIQEFDKYRFPSAEALVDASLEQGKLLILFDGLDEVPSQTLNYAIEQIEDFVDRYDNNSFVASCRIAAYRSSFRRFTDVTIAEFDNGQIEQFIDRWFGSAEDEALGTAKKYRELLSQDNHEATKELAQTPLLLTFLCLVYDREQTLPSKRSTLYERALNIILHEWSAQKRIKRDPIYEGFHSELEKLLLAKIAYDSFKQDQLFFSKDYVTERITDFLSDTLDAPKYLNADEVLEAIEVQQGILVERATDAYSFSHLTLQEYLAALHVVETQMERELITEHLVDESWREVFLLVSGLMSNRSIQLFTAIDQQARAFIAPYPKLQKFVNWAAVNRVGASELSQRAAMLAIASAVSIGDTKAGGNIDGIPIHYLSKLDRARAIATDIVRASDPGDNTLSIISSANAVPIVRAIVDDIGIGDSISDHSAVGHFNNIHIDVRNAACSEHHLLNTHSLTMISAELSKHISIFPGRDAPFYALDEWVQQLKNIWIVALCLDQESVHFSYEEAEALQKYFYANELLIQCKEAAIRVSRSEWEALERRLLTMDDGAAE
ncbi:MAG: histidine kinase [Leptolyngbya foveolarum]|uniref:Histidine kinase n=1 Tax=Leptolyngbya foveolarum TaxID=47253 RepID=A0A2W4U070_9CYAN|nr:MAG: histidine kinase [Leptolyngbya foveolarum]